MDTSEAPRLVLPMRLFASCEHPKGDEGYGLAPGRCVYYAPDARYTKDFTIPQIRDFWRLADGDINPATGLLSVQMRNGYFLSYN